MNKLLLWVGVCVLVSSAVGQVPPPVTTPLTRNLLRTNFTTANFRDALGFLTTNNTVITNYVGNGASITNLNADELRSGTVPLARLSGITASQIANDTITTGKVDSVFYELLTNTASGGGSGDVTADGLAAGSYPIKATSLSGAMQVSWTATNAVWVDVTNGVNSSGRGTMALPVASIEYAATNSMQGAVIMVQPGLYVECIRNDWGQKDYVLTTGVIIAGKTNSGDGSLVASVIRHNLDAASTQTTNNWPMRIFGRGKLVGGNDSLPTIRADNGDIYVEAELIQNPNAAGYPIEIQGDQQEDDDATQTITLQNTIVAGQIFINPFSLSRKSFTAIHLNNCTLLTTNVDPIYYDAGSGGGGESFKVILNGVESRTPQSDAMDYEGYGSRLFGELLVLTNLPATTTTGAYVQQFNPVIHSGAIYGNGVGVTNVGGVKIYRALITQSGSSAPTATVLQNTIGTITWSRSAQGVYACNSSALFTSGKTVFRAQISLESELYYSNAQLASTSQIVIRTSEDTSVPALVDDLIATGSNIEILVYP